MMRVFPPALLAALLCGGVACAQPLDGTDVARLERIAAQDASAAYDLGRMVRNGIGTARDSVRARRLIASAAQRRHAAAMFTLSAMLAAGEGGAPDVAAARHWLEEAAQMEHPEALQQLAMHVQEGTLGFVRDQQRADQLMREAAHAMKHREFHHD